MRASGRFADECHRGEEHHRFLDCRMPIRWSGGPVIEANRSDVSERRRKQRTTGRPD
jgi:hypothetical protein